MIRYNMDLLEVYHSLTRSALYRGRPYDNYLTMGIGHTKIRLNREGVEPNNVDGPDHHHHDHIAQDWGLWKYDLWDLKTQTKTNVLVNPIPVSAGSIYSTVKATRKGHYLYL